MIEERILMPGTDQSNVGFPVVRLTSYGEQIISQSTPPYYDIDGYVKYLKSENANLDPVIEQHISESLTFF